ncbi:MULTISPECIES: YfeK family protein [Pseudoalteromonas]|uniref:DUF5329 domain-containing protein n=1 Tax=Pseudoalteromonas haloplanktis TaxID=228 RepID=A0ABU1BDJ6_PSEHA|nr:MULTISPECIES: DUF5329 domain-containing protein [Pseudoalteromonas]MCF6144419.1 hypothetical protein [Pseudoalteromonas mariniglutinosa NCIMB 1770]MDQ9092586.1 DUF5329 domain-containing protein [Pseudoalteromonas haloplanktis]
MKHLSRNIHILIGCLLLCISQLSIAASAEQEVNHLISFIEQSQATFIRNGDEHTSTEAAEHLAMKYRRAGRYAKTADDFIDNLASKSSWSGKPYTVILANGTTVTANKWLTDELTRFRNTTKPQ